IVLARGCGGIVAHARVFSVFILERVRRVLEDQNLHRRAARALTLQRRTRRAYDVVALGDDGGAARRDASVAVAGVAADARIGINDHRRREALERLFGQILQPGRAAHFLAAAERERVHDRPTAMAPADYADAARVRPGLSAGPRHGGVEIAGALPALEPGAGADGGEGGD